MDRERLTELLQHPARAGTGDLPGLRAMAERFPWFSGARLLLAVGENGSGSVLAAEDQGHAAAHLPSRTVLYDLIRTAEDNLPAQLRTAWKTAHKAPEPSSAALPEHPAATTEKPAVPRKHEPVPPAAFPGADPENPPLPAAQDAPQADGAPPQLPVAAIAEEVDASRADEPLDILPHAAASTPQAIREPAAPAPPTDREKPDGERDFLDNLFVEALAAASYDIGQWSTPPPPPPPPEAAAQQPAALAAPQPQKPAVSSPANEPPPPPATIPPVPKAKMRFTDWLDQTPGTQPAPGEQKPPAAHPAPDAPTAPASVKGQRELMDRFIGQATPAPAAEKAAFFNPQKAAKRSLQDAGMVSETLARVHEKQGNFAKAREVYDRLAALYPEKSVYFAALSKALEGRSNK